MPTTNIHELPHTKISFLASVPYLLLQFFYIVNCDEFEYLACYGLSYLVIPVVLAGWVALLVLELTLRRAFSVCRLRTPWYSIAGMVFLTVFQLLRQRGYPGDFSAMRAAILGIPWMVLLLLTFVTLAKATLPDTMKVKPKYPAGDSPRPPPAKLS